MRHDDVMPLIIINRIVAHQSGVITHTKTNLALVVDETPLNINRTAIIFHANYRRRIPADI